MIDNFEPFDLARAQAGEEVQFREDGRPVRFVGVLYDIDGKVHQTVFAYREAWTNCEHELTRQPNGCLYLNHQGYSLDIVMKPKPPIKKTFWACFDFNANGKIRSGWVRESQPEPNTWQHVIPIEVTLPPK